MHRLSGRSRRAALTRRREKARRDQKTKEKQPRVPICVQASPFHLTFDAHTQATINLCIPRVKRPCSCLAKPRCRLSFVKANVSLSRSKDPRSVPAPFSTTGRRSHPYPLVTRLAKRKASLLIPSLTPPNPHAKLAGAFVIRSGFVASFSKLSSDYARGDKDGTALGVR